MMTIPAVLHGESLTPAEPFPSDAIAIVCDGENYVVYQAGDDIPKQPDAGQSYAPA